MLQKSGPSYGSDADDEDDEDDDLAAGTRILVLAFLEAGYSFCDVD